MNGEVKFPEFPSQFTESDAERLARLQELAAEQQSIYTQHYTPEAWEGKSAVERGFRGFAATAFDFPRWLRNITPWTEYGFTPAQADKYIRETEADVQELQRLQIVSDRVPVIRDYITGMALAGLLSGEEAQLYQIVPELDPSAPVAQRLPLTEEERQWFLDYAAQIATMSKEDITDAYTQGFPAPSSIDELMDLVKVSPQLQLSPDQILSVVAFSKDIELIGDYLRLAYPPQGGMTEAEQQEEFEYNVHQTLIQELTQYGIESTGNFEEDIKLLNEARLAQGGNSVMYMTPDGYSFPVVRMEDGYYDYTGVKIANFSDDGEPSSMSPGDEYEADNTPPIQIPNASNRAEAERFLRVNFQLLPEEGIQEFFALDGSEESIMQWYEKYLIFPLLGRNYYLDEKEKEHFRTSQMITMWTDRLINAHASVYEETIEPHILTQFGQAWSGGVGDLITMAGGALKMMGEDSISEGLMYRGGYLQRAMPNVASLEDFTWTQALNPRFWVTPQGRQLFLEGSRTLPFQMLLLPLTLLGWAGGATIGTAVSARFALGNFASWVVKTVFAAGGSTAVSRTLESLGEAGSTMDAMLDMGIPEEQALDAANEVFWNNMKLAGFDFGEAIVALAPMPRSIKWVANAMNSGFFKVMRVGGRIIITGLQEGAEEYYQNAIQKAAMGDPDPWAWDSEAQLAATLGGMMGMGFGGVGDVVSGIINDTQSNMSLEATEAFNQVVTQVSATLMAQGYSQELAQRVATKEALDAFAATEEGQELIKDITEVAAEEAANREIKDEKAKVNNKKIAFLQNQIDKVTVEIQTYQNSYNAKAQELEGEPAPWAVQDIKDTMQGLKEGIQILQERKKTLQRELDAQINMRANRLSMPEHPRRRIRKLEAFGIDYAEKTPQAQQREILEKARELVYKDKTIYRDANGKAVPGIHEVDSPGGKTYLLVNDQGRLAVVAHADTWTQPSTIMAIVVDPQQASTADTASMIGYLDSVNVVVPVQPLSVLAAEHIESWQERRERLLANANQKQTSGVTPLDEIIWDDKITPSTKQRVQEALEELQRTVRVDISYVAFDPTRWALERVVAAYSPKDRMLTIGYQDMEPHNIYHEVAHQLSGDDIESGNFIIWREIYGEDTVREIQRRIESQTIQSAYKVNPKTPISQHLYNLDSWYHELEESFAQNFAEYFEGLRTESGEEYRESLVRLYGERELNITKDSLLKYTPELYYLENAYGWIYGADRFQNMDYVPFPTPATQANLNFRNWVSYNKQDAWARIVEQVIGEKTTPENMWRLYTMMGITHRGFVKLLDNLEITGGIFTIEPNLSLDEFNERMSPNVPETAHRWRAIDKLKETPVGIYSTTKDFSETGWEAVFVKDKSLPGIYKVRHRSGLYMQNPVPDHITGNRYVFNSLEEAMAALYMQVSGQMPGKPPAPLSHQLTIPEGMNSQDIENGRLVNKEIAARQAMNLIGLNERKIDTSQLRNNQLDAEQFLEEQLLGADMSNPLSQAMMAAAKLGSIRQYVDLLPPDIYENVSQEFKDGKFHDSPRWNLNFQPVVDAVSVIDGGRFGGLVRKKVYQVADQSQLALLNYQGAWNRRMLDLNDTLDVTNIRKKVGKKKFDDITATLVDNMATEDIIRTDEELIQRYPDIAAALEGISQERAEMMIEYAKNMRLFFDEVLGDVNAVRVKLGRPPIPYIPHYLPEVYKSNVWGRLLGIHLKPDFLREQAQAPDFIKPSSPFNPRALQRAGNMLDYDKVRNVQKLFLDYVSVSSREMFYAPAITNAKAHARVLKSKGLDVPASYIEDWALRAMVGLPDGMTRWRRENIPPWLYNPFAMARGRLTPAVLGFNPMWNLFLQTSATAMSTLQFGTKNTLKGGLQYIFDKKARHWIDENVPSFIIKQRGRGSVVHQDMGQTMSESRRIDMSKLEKVDEIVLYFVNLFEKHLTGMGCQSAKLRAQELGITNEADLVAFVSDGGAKTQSMYDPMHLPLALSPTVRFLVPFQTFAFEALTRIREMANIKKLAKAGTYETVAADSVEGKGLVRNRFKRFAEFAVAIWLFNALGEFFNDREPWEASSFIPFANIMMLGTDPGNPWNLPMPFRYAYEFWRGFENIIQYDNWENMVKFILRYHMPAGSQAAKTLDGLLAVVQGGQFDVAGELMFEVNPEEWIKAVTLGVWRTEGGQEWLDRYIEGEPRTTQRIIEELQDMESQLGTSVDGRYYTLNEYGTDALKLFRDNSIPEWQVLEDVPIYPPLARFRLYSENVWEDYYKTPSDKRTEYRQAHPYVDAVLYFWEKVRTVRSTQAMDELEELFRLFGADENLRMHWRGLPIVPDWVQLLPE